MFAKYLSMADPGKGTKARPPLGEGMDPPLLVRIVTIIHHLYTA